MREEFREEVTDVSLLRAAKIWKLRYEDKYGNLLNLKQWVLETGDQIERFAGHFPPADR